MTSHVRKLSGLLLRAHGRGRCLPSCPTDVSKSPLVHVVVACSLTMWCCYMGIATSAACSDWIARPSHMSASLPGIPVVAPDAGSYCWTFVWRPEA
jgi:hypothetical protein